MNLREALKLRKAKYLKRTGSPGNYKYYYVSSGLRGEIKERKPLPKTISQMQREVRMKKPLPKTLVQMQEKEYEEPKGRKTIKIKATEDKSMITEKDLDKLVKKYGRRPITIVTNCGVELYSRAKMRPLKYQNIKVVKRSEEEMSKEMIE